MVYKRFSKFSRSAPGTYNRVAMRRGRFYRRSGYKFKNRGIPRTSGATGGMIAKGNGNLRPGQEIKSVDVLPTGGVLSVNPSWTLLNGCAQGAGINQRVGQRICMQSLTFRAFVQRNNSNVAVVSDDVAVGYIIYDRQPAGGSAAGGVVPTFATVVTSLSATSATSATTLDFPSINFKDRFRILRKYRWYLEEVGTGGVPTGAIDVGGAGGSKSTKLQPFFVEDFIKLSGLETIFNTVGDQTVGSMTSGSLYFVIVSQLAFSGSAPYNFSVSARLRYTDV